MESAAQPMASAALHGTSDGTSRSTAPPLPPSILGDCGISPGIHRTPRHRVQLFPLAGDFGGQGSGCIGTAPAVGGIGTPAGGPAGDAHCWLISHLSHSPI